jgi:hypothetical protein
MIEVLTQKARGASHDSFSEKIRLLQSRIGKSFQVRGGLVGVMWLLLWLFCFRMKAALAVPGQHESHGHRGHHQASKYSAW